MQNSKQLGFRSRELTLCPGTCFYSGRQKVCQSQSKTSFIITFILGAYCFCFINCQDQQIQISDCQLWFFIHFATRAASFLQNQHACVCVHSAPSPLWLWFLKYLIETFIVPSHTLQEVHKFTPQNKPSNYWRSLLTFQVLQGCLICSQNLPSIWSYVTIFGNGYLHFMDCQGKYVLLSLQKSLSLWLVFFFSVVFCLF